MVQELVLASMPPLLHLLVLLLYLSSLLAWLLLATLASRIITSTSNTIPTRTTTRTTTRNTTRTRMEQGGEARRSQVKVKAARGKVSQEKGKVSQEKAKVSQEKAKVSKVQVPQEDSIKAAFLAACGQGEEEKVRAKLGVDFAVESVQDHLQSCDF